MMLCCVWKMSISVVSPDKIGTGCYGEADGNVKLEWSGD